MFLSCTVFSCAVDSKILRHGRMYLTDKYLCFYSSIFSSEKKIRLPLCQIISISKENTVLVLRNAISVTTGNI